MTGLHVDLSQEAWTHLLAERGIRIVALDAGRSVERSRLRLSMCMIAKNERKNVRPCLESFGNHVDEIVFCDTGSRDGTVAEVRHVCEERGWTDKLKLGRFKWCDDFGKARNHAHELASGDVHGWIDLDDRLAGAAYLPMLTAEFARQPELRYVVASHGDTFRPRLIRGPVRWSGRTLEHPADCFDFFFADTVDGAVVTEQVRWQHGRTVPRGRRDLDIALKWANEEPRSWHAWFAASVEAIGAGDGQLLLDCGRRLLSLPSTPAAARGFVLRLAEAA